MPTSQQQTQRTEIENQIKNDFSELQNKLANLKSEIQSETDQTKKQEKEDEIKKMEEDLNKMKEDIDKLSSLQDEALQSLKDRLEQYKQVRQDVQWETAELLGAKNQTPTTYELLKDSGTCRRLLTIISSNPNEFAKIPWETPENKLEYIFSQIRKGVTIFLKNKLWNSEKCDKIINNTIAPAFEWNMMEMLRDQWNATNISMLKWIDKISWDNLNKLITWVGDFANTTKWSFNKFSQWMNAIDYLSIHNWVLSRPEKSAVLTSPVEFKNYLNNAVFASEKFSPYNSIGNNIFKEDESQNFEFWISLQDKQNILNQIWDIEVVNNSTTTALITKLLDKPEKFFGASVWLQQAANGLLDWANALNSVTKLVGIDLVWEITKPLEKRGFWYRVIDFVCKLIWITWWLEWIVKRWRLDRLKLTDEKNESITKIFKEYQKLAWKWNDISITDANSCSTALADFALTDLDKTSTTKWDHLRDVMAANIDINLISTSVIQQTLWNGYLNKETVIGNNGKQQEKVSVDTSKITEDKKRELVHLHIANMKTYLEWNYENMKDFYSNIHNTDDLVICMTASLYADKEDVIVWIKAKVFLPENYWVNQEWTVVDNWNNNWNENYSSGLSDLTSEEKSEMEKLVDQSKTTNTINYLENSTYKKYLNIIERDLNLPKYTLECVCLQESGWKLYSKGAITWSHAWAKWLFQFMPKTAEWYMKKDKLKEKYWKTFSSTDDFLKDPLATARAAWIMLSETMTENNYNIQAALACYNCWPGGYKTKTWWNLSNFGKLPAETQNYVKKITQNILQHNSVSSTDDFLSADLWKYLWNNSWSNNTEQKKSNEIFSWPELLAKNKDEIWWLGNSIMQGFQWYKQKSNFPNMDGVASKNTKTHPNKFTSESDISAYKASHPNVKSFMFYFWANTTNNSQTIWDITKRSKWLEKEWIQPILCTCIWEDNHTWLTDLNKSLINLWKENNWPVFDFAKVYNEWKIAMGGHKHPRSEWYSVMAWYINDQLNKA